MMSVDEQVLSVMVGVHVSQEPITVRNGAKPRISACLKAPG
ncbi:hypothetical protein [Parasphingorhabdus sp.]